MSLTLKNYAKELTKELLQLAEKNAVRECDETKKGHFVAYVDEGSESFDVSLTVSPNGGITESTCDCKNGAAFCRHKAALLLHVVKGTKTKTTVKIKKKEGAMETLLEQVQPDDLRSWVKSLIEKNKDIELAFTHYFSAKKQQYTGGEVIKLVKDAIKATIGNKRTVDATQIKKLVELWSEVLQPVVAYYQSNVMDETAFQSFHTMIEQVCLFHLTINSGSTRVPKYVDDTLHACEAALNNLLNDDAWSKSTGFFIAHIHDEANNDVRLRYLLHLQNVISASSGERREKLIGLLADQFKKSTPERTIKGAQYTKIIFGIMETYGLFPQYYHLFKPLYFDNTFNEKLISLLIENEHLGLAKKYCEDIIRSNYREEYSIPYLKLQKEISTIEKDEAGLAKVISVLFPYSYDFDDYLFIIDRMEPDDVKKWRTRMLSRARNASHGSNSNALEFSFKLMNHEGRYKKMIEYIDSYTPFDIILKYFEPMLSADKSSLLKAIINKSDSGWSYSGKAEKESLCFPQLFDLVEKHYTADYLRLLIKDLNKGKLYFYRSNGFLDYAKNRLDIDTVKQ